MCFLGITDGYIVYIIYTKSYSLLQILVTYRISWRRTAHDFCNSKEDIENKKLASGEGDLLIRSAPSAFSLKVIQARFVCTDISIVEDWATGELSEFKMNYTEFVSSSYFYLG